MKDGIIKADGTSRLARSVADFKTKYPTYDDFAAALVAGTLPLDILFNEAGWSQLPDFLNQANLLKVATAALYGKDGTAVPDDIFARIPALIDTKVDMVLLWENASPTSDFAAQTVSVDLSGYDIVAIETYTPNQFYNVGDDRYNLNAAGASRLHFWPVGSPEKINLSDFFVDFKATYSTNHVCWIMFNTRRAAVTNTGVEFEGNSCLNQKANNAQNVDFFSFGVGANGYNIPIKIYGIKGVSA